MISAYRVGNVRRLAARLEIADDDLGLPLSPLDLGDLLRESGRRKRRILPRPDVIERPSDADVNSVGHRAQREPLLRELAQAVGIGRLDRCILGEWLIRHPVDHRGAGHEQHRRQPRSAQRFNQVVRSSDVRVERRRRVVPGTADMGGTGAVIHGGRSIAGNLLGDRVAIEQVDCFRAHAGGRRRRVAAGPVPGDDIVAGRHEQLDQVTAGETGGAGHKRRTVRQSVH